MAYKGLFKRVFFLIDPETMHDMALLCGRFWGVNFLTKAVVRLFFDYRNPEILGQTVAGIKFYNPIGLAAGFDKDGLLTDVLPYMGFGFEEIGSVTGNPCQGNPKPRLWRLKKSKSLLVYFGLKSRGCEEVSQRLKGRDFKYPLGISIAKTNSEETVEDDNGIRDYVKAYKAFVDAGVGDYFTVNISCPNAFGGEPFTDPERLEKLLTAIRAIPSQKPVFIKMPSDLSFDEVDDLIAVARRHKIMGFVCTNLTKDRSNPCIKDSGFPDKGGMSGKVVQQLSDDLIAYIYKKTKGEFVIIGCGGVFTAEDAYKKIRLGASLIQLITGMIYEGPQAISDINLGLVRLLKRDGFTNISQAVGADNRD